VNPSTEWPDESEEEQLLARLLAGNPTAKEELAARFHPLLLHFLAGARPWSAEDLRGDAADRALIDFLCFPERFDPARGGLGAYLRMAAGRDLLNLLKQEKRVRRGISLDSVEEPAGRRNQNEDELSWGHPVLIAELAVLNEDERVALELMRDGVRQTAAFVTRLGLDHLDPADQTATVMRLKDRVKRRLTRAVEDSQ
jgi:hypothetical protein